MQKINNDPNYWKNRKYLRTMKEIKEEFEDKHGMSHETIKLVLGWIPKTDKILDSGSGADMKYARYLKTKGYKKVHGCDFVESTQPNYTKCDVLDLKYPDKTFNSIISCGVYHHLNKLDRGRFFRVHHRKLKKNGLLLVVVPKANSPATLLRIMQSKFKKMVVANYVRAFQISHVAKKNKFKILALGDQKHTTHILMEKK